MLFQLRAVTMESRSDSSPLGLLAAESPSMNLHFMNRRRPRRTKDAGTVQLSWGEFLCLCLELDLMSRPPLLFFRYTLTEGDFHHLKKARLTHLHLPPAPCDLKILTIMECDSTESSTINISETRAPKLPPSIYLVTWFWVWFISHIWFNQLFIFSNLRCLLSPAHWREKSPWLDGTESQWRSARRPTPLHHPGPGSHTAPISLENTAHTLSDSKFHLFLFDFASFKM